MLFRKKHSLASVLNATFYNLPVPRNITNLWNFGSSLAVVLIMQILTGVFLAIHYSSDMHNAFNCLSHIIRDIPSGWIIRLIHANGASIFFILIYCHIGRGLYFKRNIIKKTWTIGVIIFLLSIIVAFLGYVLPWGQISFWGATVITNLISALPYIGKSIVEWLWGGFSVNNATLIRFFSFHFIIPIILILLIIIHLVFLHEEKSRNPLGINNSPDKIYFHPYYSIKDIRRIILIFFIFLFLCIQSPFLLIDPDNFIPANPIVTPVHIQPEWYFLFAYAILRAIPNKLGGVLCLLLSILILLTRNFKNQKFQQSSICNLSQTFWIFRTIFLLLTWLGIKPVEQPYTLLRIIFTVLYFLWFLL